MSGRTWAEVGDAHRSGRRQLLRDLRPDLPAAFVECIESLIAPDQSQRVQTAGAAEAALQRARGTKSERRWGLLAAAATLAVVGALAVGANLDRLRGLFWGASGVRTIAVLPMANLSGDAGRDYFVDGMTDQLIAELSRISALRVTDRTSVMGYKQTTKRLNEIAGELGVDAVLEGSIVLAGPELRLTAALIRAADGLRLWSKSYERSVKDAFALQAELTRDLAGSISWP